MNHIFNLLFEPYLEVPVHLVVLEAIAVIFGFLSVLYSKRENILVYPTGIISTAIFVYILWYWGLLGDMLINGYYFAMSIYGWYVWTRKVDPDHFTPVTVTSPKEQLWSVFLFVATMGLVSLVYEFFDKWDGWVSYIDVVTTAVFFVGMWLMARKKLENWIYWIIGDLISVPLYLYKGLTLTSIQYFIFTIIAVYGYVAWRQNLNKSPETLLR